VGPAWTPWCGSTGTSCLGVPNAGGWGGLLVLPRKLAGMRERECYLGATVGAGMGGQGTTMTGQWAWRASQPGTEPASWCQRWPGAPMTRASALK